MNVADAFLFGFMSGVAVSLFAAAVVTLYVWWQDCTRDEEDDCDGEDDADGEDDGSKDERW